MATNNTKLELTWIDKYEERPGIEPRIFIEDSSHSCGEIETGMLNNGKPWNGNMLIHGDNLLALKALEQHYSGSIKCIYIDPPYNTGNAFEQYDDNVEHSIWLSLMRDRLVLLRNLLAPDGVIFVQINDDEAAYLKVLLDEVFGRRNYETTFYIKVRHEDRILREDSRYQLVMEQVFCYRKTDLYEPPRRPKTKNSSDDYEYKLEVHGTPVETIHIGIYDVEVYRPEAYSIIRTEKGEGDLKYYQIRGSLITQAGSASEYYEKYLRERRSSDGLGTMYKVLGMGINGDGLGYRTIFQPTKEDSKNGFYLQGKPLKQKENKGLPYPNYYDYVQVFNNAGYEGGVDFKGGKKPEAYLQFILSLAGIKPGDVVLDSFLGSGSTAAVCSKLKIRWIGVEIGDHAYTHCYPRLKRIVDGTDDTGISSSINWKGGGGFKFYELAPSLLKKDSHGHLVINKEYNADMLAAAMAKMEGFTYEPSTETFWKQGHSSETDYIYTTTQFLTVESLGAILDTMADGESLLICCKAFQPECKNFSSRITVKKIPSVLLGRCEFDHDDYSLNIIELPQTEEIEDSEDMDNYPEASSDNLSSEPSLF